VRAAVLPNYAQCLDVGKQTIAAQLGYISGAVPHRPAHTGSRSRSVAVLAHGHATTTSTTPSADGRGLGGFADGSVPPCPIELVAEPGQRINFTLYDFAPRNLTYPNTVAGQLDYTDDNLSKICHRSE